MFYLSLYSNEDMNFSAKPYVGYLDRKMKLIAELLKFIDYSTLISIPIFNIESFRLTSKGEETLL